MNDPLHSILFAKDAEEDDVVEEVPIHEDIPLASENEDARPPLFSRPERHESVGGFSLRTDGEDEGTTRVDALASYGQLVSPPSYDDSVMFDRGEIQPEHSRAAAQGTLTIKVNDPVKKVEQSVIPGVAGGYVTYRVQTTTSLPGFARREIQVRRRFRDFVALAELLKVTHRGYFVPPRPEKNTVEGQRASAEFIELRRAALQAWMEKLAMHPVIRTSEELKVFLETEGALTQAYGWQQLQPLHGSILEGVARLPKQLFGQERSIPAPQEVTQSTRHTSDLLRRFKELGQTMKAEYKDPVVLGDDEVALRNEHIQIDEFQEKVAAASRKAEALVSKFEDLGNVLGELGMSLIKLAKFEDEDGTRCGSYTEAGTASKLMSADSRRVGMAAVRLCRLNRTATVQTTMSLSPLHDHLALTPAVEKALKEREVALATLQSCEADLAAKRGQVAGLEPEARNNHNKQRKVALLQNDIASLEATVEAARAEYRKVKQRNMEEMARWKGARKAEFGALVAGLARVGSAYQDRSLNVWLQVAEEFNSHVPNANDHSSTGAR